MHRQPTTSLRDSPTLPATGTNAEHFQNVRHLDKAPFLRKLGEVRIDADIDALRTPAGTTGEVMVVIRAMGEAVHLGAVLAHSALYGAGSLERFETSINGNDVAGLRVEGFKGFFGGKRALGLRENAQDGSPLLGDTQAGRSQGSYGLIEKMRMGALGHESNLTNWNGCEKGITGCMDGS